MSSDEFFLTVFQPVLYPPAVLITSMLKDLNAQERDTITFEVTVNHEGITYKWLKNGVEVKSSDRCQVRSRQLTHSLTIRNVHFGDGGEYQFVAGSAASAANLFVEGNVMLIMFTLSRPLTHSCGKVIKDQMIRSENVKQ